MLTDERAVKPRRKPKVQKPDSLDGEDLALPIPGSLRSQLTKKLEQELRDQLQTGNLLQIISADRKEGA